MRGDNLCELCDDNILWLHLIFADLYLIVTFNNCAIIVFIILNVVMFV